MILIIKIKGAWIRRILIKFQVSKANQSWGKHVKMILIFKMKGAGLQGLKEAMVVVTVEFYYTWPELRELELRRGRCLFAGLLDNVLSDYLWAKALLLTTPTAATAGLNIQIPIAAVVDSVRGMVPSPLRVLGAAAVLVGFFGINQPATGCCGSSSNEEVDDFDNVKQSTDV